MRREYLEQARLMLRVMPLVAKESSFALKGGTAINFFVRDMPRLSVDIDLVYLPITSRQETMAGISAALKRIKADAQRVLRAGHSVQEGVVGSHTSKLFVKGPGGSVKVEPNFVLRGSVAAPAKRVASKKVVATFDMEAEILTMNDADLYGGKICAALDRQHPRDLFDVKVLLANEGVTAEMRKAFVVYLSGHPRPMHEVLDPNRVDITQIFEDAFQGMTDEVVTIEELVAAREKLVSILKAELSGEERNFLLSLNACEPDFKLLDMPGIEKLPSIQWKLQNLRKMDAGKRKSQMEELRRKLGL